MTLLKKGKQERVVRAETGGAGLAAKDEKWQSVSHKTGFPGIFVKPYTWASHPMRIWRITS